MTTLGICDHCATNTARFGDMRAEPGHCYGKGDIPAPGGVLGGFRCSCECRTWPAAGEAK